MLRRILQILSILLALLFLAGAMVSLGFGPFGGTKVRRLFGASPEALRGNARPADHPVEKWRPGGVESEPEMLDEAAGADRPTKAP